MEPEENARDVSFGKLHSFWLLTRSEIVLESNGFICFLLSWASVDIIHQSTASAYEGYGAGEENQMPRTSVDFRQTRLHLLPGSGLLRYCDTYRLALLLLELASLAFNQ